MRRVLVVFTVALATIMAGAWPAAGASTNAESVLQPSPSDRANRVDFNGDGFDDLAIGVPGEGFGGLGLEQAGAVNVLYGAAGGLVGTDQLLTQANPEASDFFGAALAKGDFNGDGFTDLAVSAPQEGSTTIGPAGAVNVFYGSAAGLPATSQVLTQANPEDGDFFGRALDAGLFNDDAFMDLAVGAPGEALGMTEWAGAVNVFYGSAAGLPASSQVLHQANPESFDQFGAALAAGFFNAGEGDLAVGAPGEWLGTTREAGAVNVFYGTPSGLPGVSQILIQGNPETADRFGSALAAGFFDNDLWYDLAVGAPTEDVGANANAGAVNVFFGSASTGLAGSARQSFVQGPGTGGTAEPGDRFGTTLAAGFFDAGGPWDLAVGAPAEDVGARVDAGAVNVLYGSATGLGGRNQLLVQGSPGLLGTAESGDRFGSALARGIFFNDFNNDGLADLAVGAVDEDVGAISNAGAVNVLYGSVSGLPGTGGQLFTQDSPGVADTAEPGDLLGWALD